MVLTFLRGDAYLKVLGWLASYKNQQMYVDQSSLRLDFLTHLVPTKQKNFQQSGTRTRSDADWSKRTTTPRFLEFTWKIDRR